MARKSRQSYLKRQKELRRMEKASIKRQRRIDRNSGLPPEGIFEGEEAEEFELEGDETEEEVGFEFHELDSPQLLGPESDSEKVPRTKKESLDSAPAQPGTPNEKFPGQKT